MYGTLYGSLPYGAAALIPAATTPSPSVFKVLSPIDSDAATLVASSELPTLPVGNLQTMQPGKVWRTDAATSATLTLTFPAGVATNALALVGHNLSADGIIRVRLARTVADLPSSAAVDTGWQSAWPRTGKPADA